MLRQLAPLILEHQGSGAIVGFLLDSRSRVTRQLGGYELEIGLDEIFGFKAEIGYGLIIAIGPDTFVGAGSGFRVVFRAIRPARRWWASARWTRASIAMAMGRRPPPERRRERPGAGVALFETGH